MIVEERGSQVTEIDDQVARWVWAIEDEQLVDCYAAHQIMAAAPALTIAIWVLDRIVHASAIGTGGCGLD